MSKSEAFFLPFRKLFYLNVHRTVDETLSADFFTRLLQGFCQMGEEGGGQKVFM
jgi:hypothetical protein